MIKNKLLLSLTVASMLTLGACASKGDKTASTPPPSTPSSAYSDTSGTGNQLGDEDARTAAERALSNNLVYFDYDSSAIKPEYASVVGAYAKYLTANPVAKVRIEGHTDERGTREYNIGLGERRANAVKDALTAQGVTSAQISVISYGEERPVAEGHDESAWSQNRRAQIIRQ
ncbi:peptidoglycan-associated lipoprotein Pal [Solimonas flava]|uniref:peptidoglycan-associated lipoprotein Pal n=1 Tax=Solimonas flava TaxID=415849 RepID=UPI0004222756|nr:peptidoglycan-associated lipoprotein Pal [Solimonas flava]